MDKYMICSEITIVFIIGLSFGLPVNNSAGTNTNCEYGVAVYNLTFSTWWSEENFPKQYPQYRPNAQWSQLVGRTHSEDFTLFRLGELSSQAMKELAELGTAKQLSKQTQGSGGVLDAFRADGIPAGVGTAQATLFLDGKHSLFSAAAKLIPSPDWFVGIDSLDLCHDGQWVEKIERELWIYDAGTDKGFTFSSPNWEERPPQAITVISSSEPSHPANSFFYPEYEELPTIATITLRKVRHYVRESRHDSPQSDVAPVTQGDDSAPSVTTEAVAMDTQVFDLQPETYEQVKLKQPDMGQLEDVYNARGTQQKGDTEDREVAEESLMFQWPQHRVLSTTQVSVPSTPVTKEAETNQMREHMIREEAQNHEPTQTKPRHANQHKDRPQLQGDALGLREPAVQPSPEAIQPTSTEAIVTKKAKRKHQKGGGRGKHSSKGRHRERPPPPTTARPSADADPETPPTPVDCEIGWSEWTECSQTCGYGSQTRSYGVRVRPQHGGEPCPQYAHVQDETQLCGSMRNCEWVHFSFSNWRQP